MLRRFPPPPPPPYRISPLIRTRFSSVPESATDPSSSTTYSFVQFLSSASKSSSLLKGQQSHSLILKLGLSSNLFINTTLLDLYFKCRRFSDAHKLFDEMPERNSVTWNTLIYGNSQSPTPLLAIKALKYLIFLGIELTHFGVSSVCVAVSRIGDLGMGKMLHRVGFTRGLCGSLVSGTSLVDMYSKCLDLVSARRAFDEMNERNVITWTSLVTGYALDQRPGDAMLLFREMKRLGVGMNRVTYNSLLAAFSVFEDLGHGKQVHCLVTKVGLDFDPFISVTLVTMYSKCGNLDDFIKMCDNVSVRDQVSCNAIIAGFSHSGNDYEVLDRFLQMRKECIEADFFTYACVLRGIGIFSALQEGRQTHALILKSGHDSNVCVQNGLVSMYARCGVIDDSKKVFAVMIEPDMVSWNSLVSGCAQHGFGIEAIKLFEQMRTSGEKPNSTSFLSVLSACSHVGLVDKGLEYFHMMKQEKFSVVLEREHYACMVDLLSRNGRLEEAESFINTMPVRPTVSIYRALLSACKVYGNMEIAKRAAKCLLEICPDDPSTHLLLSNVFAADECWENVLQVRGAMRGKGARRQPALSLVDERIIAI